MVAWYRPALTALLLLLSDLQPLPQQEALPSRRGAGRGAPGPGRRAVLIAGRRDLNGRQLQVLLGARVTAGRVAARDGQPLPLALLLTGHVPHPPHLETFATQRRRGGAGAHAAIGHRWAAAVGVDRPVVWDADLEGRGSEGVTHSPQELTSKKLRPWGSTWFRRSSGPNEKFGLKNKLRIFLKASSA